jgi:hypothetical protein
MRLDSSPIPRHFPFICHLCSAEVKEQIYWQTSGNSALPAHYHCAYQLVDYGHVQMQMFSLEDYIDAP